MTLTFMAAVFGAFALVIVSGKARAIDVAVGSVAGRAPPEISAFPAGSEAAVAAGRVPRVMGIAAPKAGCVVPDFARHVGGRDTAVANGSDGLARGVLLAVGSLRGADAGEISGGQGVRVSAEGDPALIRVKGERCAITDNAIRRG